MEPYRKRLERDLDAWIARGWVSPENRARILKSVPDRRPGFSAGGAAAILGAVLVVLGVLSFVAANWADLAPGWRFLLLCALLAASFGGAAWSFTRQRDTLGHALLVIGSALFGACIILTAQTFNMSAFRNTGVAMWAAGAFAAAVLTPSRPALILAGVLAALWLALEAANPFSPRVLWGFLPFAGALFIAANRMKSIVTANIASAAVIGWAGATLVRVGDDGRLSQLEGGALFVLFCAAFALAGAALRDRKLFGSAAPANWGAAAAVGAGFILQLPLAWYSSVAENPGDTERLADAWARAVGDPGGLFFTPALALFMTVLLLSVLRGLSGRMSWLVVLAVAAAALSAGALPGLVQAVGDTHILPLRVLIGAVLYALAGGLIAHGARTGRRFAATIGVILFIAHSLHVYTVLFGDLLRTSLFFILGGLLFIGLSVAAEQWRRRSERRARSAESAS